MGQQDGNGTTIDNIRISPIVHFNRVLVNGVCACATGYFDNGFNT